MINETFWIHKGWKENLDKQGQMIKYMKNREKRAEQSPKLPQNIDKWEIEIKAKDINQQRGFH